MVLVIEDNRSIRENICEILEVAGYEVSSASNGKEGIAMAIEKLPDVIVCDIMMPEANGYEVLKTIRNYEETHLIPFIFLTASAEKSEVQTGLGMGADGYIRKPFSSNELITAIEAALDKSKLRNDSKKSEPVNIS